MNNKVEAGQYRQCIATGRTYKVISNCPVFRDFWDLQMISPIPEKVFNWPTTAIEVDKVLTEIEVLLLT